MCLSREQTFPTRLFVAPTKHPADTQPTTALQMLGVVLFRLVFLHRGVFFAFLHSALSQNEFSHRKTHKTKISFNQRPPPPPTCCTPSPSLSIHSFIHSFIHSLVYSYPPSPTPTTRHLHHGFLGVDHALHARGLDGILLLTHGCRPADFVPLRRGKKRRLPTPNTHKSRSRDSGQPPTTTTVTKIQTYMTYTQNSSNPSSSSSKAGFRALRPTAPPLVDVFYTIHLCVARLFERASDHLDADSRRDNTHTYIHLLTLLSPGCRAQKREPWLWQTILAYFGGFEGFGRFGCFGCFGCFRGFGLFGFLDFLEYLYVFGPWCVRAHLWIVSVQRSVGRPLSPNVRNATMQCKISAVTVNENSFGSLCNATRIGPRLFAAVV